MFDPDYKVEGIKPKAFRPPKEIVLRSSLGDGM